MAAFESTVHHVTDGACCYIVCALSYSLALALSGLQLGPACAGAQQFAVKQ